MKLSRKMPMAVAGLVALTVAAVGIIAVVFSESALHKSAEEKLIALVDSRAVALSSYLTSIDEDLGLLAMNDATISAATAFNDSFSKLGRSEARRLYIDDNPNVGKLWDLVSAKDGSAYTAAHAQYHSWFKTYAETRGYYDIFLISPVGDVVYSYTKEPDFGTNLADGPWKETDLAKVWRAMTRTRATRCAPSAISRRMPPARMCPRVSSPRRLCGQGNSLAP